jgi:hypothetical protein
MKGGTTVRTYGDNKEGFSVDVVGGAVLVTARGFWSTEIAEALDPAVTSAVRGEGRRTRLIFEVGDLRPLRDEGQAAFKAVISKALAGGTPEVVIRSSSALTKLQMLRIARELGKPEIRFE